MQVKDQFWGKGLYLSFRTCNEADIIQLRSCSIHKYNISMLSGLSYSVKVSVFGAVFGVWTLCLRLSSYELLLYTHVILQQ